MTFTQYLRHLIAMGLAPSFWPLFDRVRSAKADVSSAEAVRATREADVARDTVAQARERLASPRLPLFQDGLGNEPAHAARHHDQALGVLRHVLHRQRRALDLPARHQPDEVLVALERGRQRG